MNCVTIWKNLIRHEGESFYTVRNIEFTYKICGDELQPFPNNSSKIDAIHKNTIEKICIQNIPIKKTTTISKIFRAPAYICALLNDSRIV